MNKSPFRLETDDGLGEDPNTAKKGPARKERRPPPRETLVQKEAPPPSLIWVNPNDRPGLAIPHDPNRFDRDRIFQAVVVGDPELLNGLSDYLRKTSSCLSDTKYTDGETGKTCLMKALLNLKDGRNPTIPLLLKIDKETENPRPLVNVACTGSYYKGQTALHIAIEKRNEDLVKLLVENEADVHVKACGLFFQKDHKEAHFYFGELPLSLAACTNQPDIVKYLLDNKARLTEQDSMGNTVLHALVMVADDTEKNTEFVVNMYDMILMEGARMEPASNLEEIKNGGQLTPLTLAVKTGKVKILKHILHREMKDPKFQHLSRKFTDWTYGPIHISLYDLTSIDTCQENSMLEILAYNSDIPNRYKMFALEPLNQLLQHKWDSYIRKRFYFSIIPYLTFMLVFTATAYYQTPKDEPLVPTTVTFRLLGAVIVLIGGIYLFIAQSVHFWRRRHSLKSLLMDSWFDIFLFLQAINILVSSVMFLVRMEYYRVPMVFALLLGWVNMVYYIRHFQKIGVYIMMIQKVILEDLFPFLMIYMVLLTGFATALIFLTEGTSVSAYNVSHPPSDKSKDQAVYSGLFQTLLLLFKFTIGMADLEYKENLKHSLVEMLLVLTFVLLTYILLLNMLIALMSETVNKVSEESQSIWQLQRAIAILEIEKNWIWCWKKDQRVSIYRSIPSEDKEDQRLFLRVQKVNWEDWTEKPALKEEPTETMLLEGSSGSNIRSWAMAVMSRLTPSEGAGGRKRREGAEEELRELRTGGGEESPGGEDE